MKTKKIRTYSELSKLRTFSERFDYLKMDGIVGADTFGHDRYLNQRFYHSFEWRRVRDLVIARDLGCDLGVSGHEIYGQIYIHHMNPITQKDIVKFDGGIIDPEYLICTTLATHNAIHYGQKTIPVIEPIVRTPNDTCPWKMRKEEIHENRLDGIYGCMGKSKASCKNYRK